MSKQGLFFKNHLSKLQSLVNILELFEQDELKPKVKTKIKELLENGLSYAFKVGTHFIHLTCWSINMAPEIQGYYSWYSLGGINHSRDDLALLAEEVESEN